MHYLLFGLFFVLFTSRALGFDLSLAPGLSVKNAFLYLIFALLAVETALTRRRRLELLPVFVPFALYVFYAVFSWAVVVLLVDYPTYSPLRTLIALKSGPIENLLVLLVFFYGTRDAPRAIWLIRNIVFLIVIGNVFTVVDALGVMDLTSMEMRQDGRVGGPIGQSNEYAHFLDLFLPVIVATYLVSTGPKKLLMLGGLVISGIAYMMALSRGAIVGLAAAGVAGAFWLRAMISPTVIARAGLTAMLLSVAILGGAFAAGYGDLILERFGQFTAGSHVASSGRTTFWTEALRSMLQQPISFLTGYGWEAYESSREFRYATHNEYLNILYNLGAIGLSFFLVTALNVLRTARAGIRHAAGVSRPFLIAFVFGFLALLGSIFFGGIYAAGIYVWAFVGICMRLAVLHTAAEAATDEERAGSLPPVPDAGPAPRGI